MNKRLFATLLIALLLPVSAWAHSENSATRHDFSTALREVIPLAERGNAAAQDFLGNVYNGGLGVPRNYVEAVKWYRRSATQGFPDAQRNLGNSYRSGHGVAQDYVEAVRWYRKAAVQGSTEAQRNLGNMYAKGLGVPGDFVLAYKWLNIAATAGHKVAVKERGKLAKKMLHADIAQAQLLSRAWWANHKKRKSKR